MTERSSRDAAALAVVISAFLAVALAGALAGTAGAGHGASANYTVVPDNHQPGYEGNALEHYAAGLKKDMTAMHYIVLRSEGFNFADCNAGNTRAFGIDRGNDDPGTHTDESLLDAYKGIDYQDDKVVVTFYKEESLAGGPVHINTTDQIVARSAGCNDNPPKAGWYQISGKINGSTNGNTQTDFSQSVKTHYIAICDCENREQARQKLGPPPSEEGGDGGGGGDGSTPTATATATSGGGGGGGSTPTPTATATSSGGGGGGSTPSATTSAAGGGGGGGTTPSATSGDRQAQGTGSGGNSTLSKTPTGGGGPGFGVVAGLVALLSVIGATQLRRRD